MHRAVCEFSGGREMIIKLIALFVSVFILGCSQTDISSGNGGDQPPDPPPFDNNLMPYQPVNLTITWNSQTGLAFFVTCTDGQDQIPLISFTEGTKTIVIPKGWECVFFLRDTNLSLTGMVLDTNNPSNPYIHKADSDTSLTFNFRDNGTGFLEAFLPSTGSSQVLLRDSNNNSVLDFAELPSSEIVFFTPYAVFKKYGVRLPPFDSIGFWIDELGPGAGDKDADGIYDYVIWGPRYWQSDLNNTFLDSTWFPRGEWVYPIGSTGDTLIYDGPDNITAQECNNVAIVAKTVYIKINVYFEIDNSRFSPEVITAASYKLYRALKEWEQKINSQSPVKVQFNYAGNYPVNDQNYIVNDQAVFDKYTVKFSIYNEARYFSGVTSACRSSDYSYNKLGTINVGFNGKTADIISFTRCMIISVLESDIPSMDNYDVYLHEIGHLIGLGHVPSSDPACTNGSVMSIDNCNRTLSVSDDDISVVVEVYRILNDYPLAVFSTFQDFAVFLENVCQR